MYWCFNAVNPSLVSFSVQFKAMQWIALILHPPFRHFVTKILNHGDNKVVLWSNLYWKIRKRKKVYHGYVNSKIKSRNKIRRKQCRRKIVPHSLKTCKTHSMIIETGTHKNGNITSFLGSYAHLHGEHTKPATLLVFLGSYAHLHGAS